MSRDVIVGIDLGTTNSEVAALVGERVVTLGPGSQRMLPSCVGLSPSGELLIGQAARNQQLLYPERTVRSVKRKMGSGETVRLGERTFTPQEISALILRELAEWARKSLGVPVAKAVITVPAYFTDAQRSATREAGALAGLEVVRILNEPTAASLAYGHGDGRRRTVMIYDLGGGTFDVSIVTTEGEVTEVLASHGDTRLGGDDFDELIAARLLRAFEERHRLDLSTDALARSRILFAAEEAKRKLSGEPHVVVREEALAVKDGVALHLEHEISREDYEAMIRPLVERTLASVSRALDDAKKRPSELDAILLVGGSTRTPLIARVLEERTGIAPRQEVHPDLCVALGAGVLASRLAGHDVERVLVDVSPHSFGPSYLGELDGHDYDYCYKPIISRNTPLPVTRAERYFTASPFQEKIEWRVFQGDDRDALKNTLVGRFVIEGLRRIPDPNEVICRMTLDLDGILNVSAIEKATGLEKSVRIEGVLRARSEADLAAARDRMRELYAKRAEDAEEEDELEERGDDDDEPIDSVAIAAGPGDGHGPLPPLDAPPRERLSPAPAVESGSDAARVLLQKSRDRLVSMNEEDREEAVALNERLEAAIAAGEEGPIAAAREELEDLLFFTGEGRK